MKELSYPFCSAELLQKRRSLRRTLLADGSKRIHKKIAVLGGSTTSDIVKMLELFLLDAGIEPEFYESEYNQYWEDAVFGTPELDAFRPDIVFIHTSNRNIRTFPAITDTPEQVDALLDEQFRVFETMWEKLREKFGCVLIQNDFEPLFYRLMGNRDAWDIHGANHFIHRLNDRFFTYAQTHEGFYLNDLNYVASCYGLDRWNDLSFWYLYKYIMCMDAIPSFAFNLANVIKSVYGKNKKLIALDMDNTLWGGIVGDDGVENLELGEETATAQCFDEFQSYLKKQKSLGVMLSIASKNERENALAGLKHPDSRLSEDDFVVIKANWEPKDKSIRDTAAELNLGADSFVFVDDNPAEREIVASRVPGIAVPEMTAPEEYIRALDKNAYFEVTSFTADDLRRNEMYRQNAARASLLTEYSDYGAYLDGLEMVGEIKPFNATYLQRIAQLTNKSNQFNLTTRRYTVEEIEQLAADPAYLTLYGRLADKFGDNGVVAVTIGHIDGEVLDIELWLMSCRVLKRDMEFAMLDTLAAAAAERGLKELRGHYYPTAKNKMVSVLYADFGFEKTASDEEGNTEWRLSLEGYENRNHHIRVNP